MIFENVLKIINEQIKETKKIEGAILFDNGIVSFDDYNGNFNIGVHLGGFHDKMDSSSKGFIDDAEGYLSDEWEEGDEERIVYKDKLVIFGFDNTGQKYFRIYPYKKVEEDIEV